MPLRPPPRLPATVALPAAFPRDLMLDIVRALPRPHPKHADGFGRIMIHTALEIARCYRPTNPAQAAIVTQLVIDQAKAREMSQVAAASTGSTELRMRAERHGLSLSRNVATLQRQLLRQQAACEERGENEEGEPWDYELVLLEELWMDGPLAAPLTVEAPAVKPAAKKVWSWQKNGRTYMHQIKDWELDELMEAHKRGEIVDWPPYRPGDPGENWVPDPKSYLPFKPWQEMTKQERLDRYGYKHPPGFPTAEKERLAAEAKAREEEEASVAAQAEGAVAAK